MPMILSEFIIFNDEHENGKVSGVRSQVSEKAKDATTNHLKLKCV